MAGCVLGEIRTKGFRTSRLLRDNIIKYDISKQMTIERYQPLRKTRESSDYI